MELVTLLLTAFDKFNKAFGKDCLLPLDEKSHSTPAVDAQALSIRIFFHFGRRISYEEVFPSKINLLFRILTTLETSDNKKIGLSLLKRHWTEVDENLTKLEKAKQLLKLSSDFIVEKANTLGFEFDGRLKKIIGDSASTYGGHVLKIKDGEKTENLKCVGKAAESSEDKYLRGIKHPNIVRLLGRTRKYDFDFFLFNDYGSDVRSLLNKSETFPLEKTIPMVKDFYDALKYLSNRKIVHGNIKPENLTIDSAGKLIIINFEAAHLEGYIDSRLWTKWYCAPEYWSNYRDTKYDVWSGALVFWEILHGDPGWFDIDDEQEIEALILSKQLVFSSANLKLNTILNKALENDHYERGSAVEMTLLLKNTIF